MHQMLDDFLDSDPTLRQNTLFVSADAERENRERSVYRLFGRILNEHKCLFGMKTSPFRKGNVLNRFVSSGK